MPNTAILLISAGSDWMWTGSLKYHPEKSGFVPDSGGFDLVFSFAFFVEAAAPQGAKF